MGYQSPPRTLAPSEMHTLFDAFEDLDVEPILVR